MVEQRKLTKRDWNNRFYRFIRRGEYDLVNVSLIGFDPNTGQPYKQFHDEYSAALAALVDAWEGLRWWQLRTNWRLRLATAALKSHEGMP